MKTKGGLILGLFFLLWAIPSMAMEPVKVRMATFNLGSSWYVYGALMADILRNGLPKGSTVDILPHAGGVGNPKLVYGGEAEMALGFNVTAKWALEGKLAYDKKMPTLRGLVGALDEYFVGIVATKKSKITSLAEIPEKRMPIHLVTVPKGGMGEYANQQIMEAYGAGYDEIKSFGGKVTHTSFSVIAKMLVDGRADLFMQVITVGHPAMTEIATTTDVTFLSLREDVVKKLSQYGWIPATIPAGTFKHQDQKVPTVGLTTNLIATDKMPNDLAYAITKAICENQETLSKGHAGLKSFNPRVAWKAENLGVPLHPGAERFYKEKGLMP